MTLNRGTLPQEFFDITSDMLLVQPEPQYLHGAMLQAAMGASLTQVSDIGLPFRMLGGAGAMYGSTADDRLALEDKALSVEAVKVIAELGKKPGHTVRVNRPAFANTTYTQASRTVPSGATISTTPIDVSSEQVAITIQRFAGPYDSTNSRVAPFGLERFDSSMSIHKFASIAGKHLKRDYDRFIDAVGVLLWASGSTTIRPTGFTADNDSTAAGDAAMSYDVLSRVETQLDTANIPYFANGMRMCVLHPRQVEQLRGDPAFQRLSVFQPDKNPLRQCYVASVGNLAIYKSNTLTTATNGSSVVMYRGQAFGPGMIGCGVSRIPEVLPSTADNYGETPLVIWLSYLGFQVLDNRFGCLITTS